MNEHIHLRAARESDAAFLQEVYRYYIDNTEASYNDRAKPVAAYAESIRELSKQYPFLIAEDESWLIFAEVKLRRSAGYGAAREFVDARKQERLRKTALMWLEAHETLLQPRFDVIEIYAPEGIATRRPAVRHIEDAFI